MYTILSILNIIFFYMLSDVIWGTTKQVFSGFLLKHKHNTQHYLTTYFQ